MDEKGIYAWMGVPLNAGAVSIGAISIASRDPAVIYTDEQRDLLQAIADPARLQALLADQPQQR